MCLSSDFLSTPIATCDGRGNVLEKLGIDLAERDQCLRLLGGKSCTLSVRRPEARAEVVMEAILPEGYVMGDAEHEMLVESTAENRRKQQAWNMHSETRRSSHKGRA